MRGNHAQRAPSFAYVHAAFVAYCYRIRKQDDNFTAVSEHVYVGPVPTFIARVNPDLEAGNDDLRQPRYT